MEPPQAESDDLSSPSRPLSRRHRSPICFASCFRSDGRSTESSSSRILPSTAEPATDFGGKRRSLAGRRRHRSADFRYDPLAYALNFDEGAESDVADEVRCRNFSSRLPPSPPPPPTTTPSPLRVETAVQGREAAL